ncbi:ogr/Delta-like zinc finger family protein [Pseudomonas helleri]|uniref:ogr/Delta-like zinc finger family protein n=1 Tax=Pseudomonas helleri TaxID=1608996 RepID=UPI003FD1CECF
MRVICHCCDGKALISEVEEVSPDLKKLYCLCLNHKCGHSFVMELCFSHTLKPSAKKAGESLLERFRELSSAQQLQMFEQLDSLK